MFYIIIIIINNILLPSFGYFTGARDAPTSIILIFYIFNIKYESAFA